MEPGTYASGKPSYYHSTLEIFFLTSLMIFFYGLAAFKCEMLLDINRLDSSVGRATGFHSQGCEFKPHQGQNFFLIYMYNMKSKKLSNKFISRKIKKFLPYP